MPKYFGKCSRCGKTYSAQRKGDIIICDCWKTCPVCGSLMEHYTPEVMPNVYGYAGKRELRILMVCWNTSAHPDKIPFYSVQKPVEVVCDV